MAIMHQIVFSTASAYTLKVGMQLQTKLLNIWKRHKIALAKLVLSIINPQHVIMFSSCYPTTMFKYRLCVRHYLCVHC